MRRCGRWSLIVICAALLAVAVIGPATATASQNVGSGAVTGSLAFASPGVPPAGQPCTATSFTLSGMSTNFVYNTVIMGYLGNVNISGAGGSACEGTSGGSGSLTLTDVRGTGTTGSRIECANPTLSPPTKLTGGYTRTGTDVEAVVGGTCTINGYSAPVLFSFHGAFEPSGFGVGGTPPSLTAPGLNAPITQAMFQGAFVVEPA